MRIEHHRWFSDRLNTELGLNVYGQEGKPMVIFPAEKGDHREYEGFGMVGAISDFIETGKIQLFTLDSFDAQSWCNYDLHPAERAKNHQKYDNYFIEEVVPLIRKISGGKYSRFISSGCSMGGYHSANFFFRHPEIFDTLIANSGVYRLKLFIGDYMDPEVYLHTPLAYLANLEDLEILDKYRKSTIIISVGQGSWEDDMIEDTHNLDRILQKKQVDAWIDYWGFDVEHDWPWWRRKVPYFLSKLSL